MDGGRAEPGKRIFSLILIRMSRHKNVRRDFVFSLCLCFVILCSRAYAQYEGSSPNAAVLSQASGDVFLREGGATVWQPAAQGRPLSRGDIVRTGAGASALITFPNRGYIKILPLSEAAIDSVVSPGGAPCAVVVMDAGRIWARMDVTGTDEQFLVMTNNSIINGRQASAFIESGADQAGSCLDVMKGNISIRPLSAQHRVTTLSAGQRTLIGADQTAMPPITIKGAFDDSEQNRSCMNTDEAAEQAAPAAAGASETGSGSEISEDDDLLVFSAAPAATPAAASDTTPAATETSSGESGETGAAGEDEDEYEYETVVIHGSASLSVIKSNTECSTPPVLSGVEVSGQSMAEGDALVLKSISKCGPLAKPVITWTASPKCGTISSMSVTSGGAITRIPGGGSGAAQGRAVVEINDTTVRDVVVKALDTNGMEAQFAFQLSISGEEALPPPRITNLTVNAMPVKANTELEITSDLCESAQFLIEGEAKSDCGEIVDVSVTAHEAPLTVDGTDEWDASVYINDSQNVPVIVTTRDVTGARSAPYKFSIEFTKSTVPPEVSVDTAGGYPAPSFGEPLDVYRNDLIGGRLVITGGAGSDLCYIKKVEVSADNGSTWSKAVGSSGWSYGFIPRDGDYEILARAYDNDENLSDEMFMPLELTYFSKTKEEILQEAFEEILRAYQDRDADTIISKTASNYSSSGDSIEDRGRLDSALNGRFLDISSVYLRYRVESVTVSGSSGRVTFSWDTNQSGSGYSKTGTFIFQKEGRPDWKMVTVEDSRSFLRYTNIADTIDLTSSSTQLTANNTDTATITAIVKDSAGNAVKNGTSVQFAATTGTIASSAVTADGKAELAYTASDVIGTAAITATSGSASTSVVLTLNREFAPPPPPAP